MLRVCLRRFRRVSGARLPESIALVVRVESVDAKAELGSVGVGSEVR